MGKRQEKFGGKAMTHRCVKILSPAKINLFLEIVGKRQDGFHEIKTVFQCVNLCDILTVRPKPHGITLLSNAEDLPLDGRNLAHKAAQLFLSENKIKSGVEIRMLKRIPVSGGLGGGSSNAACTLLAMDKLFGTRCGMQKLLKWAQKLGSDVPFFLRGVPSLAMGRGTELVPLKSYVPFWIVLAGPKDFHLKNKTAEVYRALNMGLTTAGVPVTITLAAIETKSVNALSKSLFNRLENVVLEKFSFARKIRRFMKSHGAGGVLVSGAGPTVFGIVSGRAHGVKLEKALMRKFGERVHTKVTRTLARTPAPVFSQWVR